MSAHDFKRQLAKCPDQRAVDRLLQGWHGIRATFTEFQELREAVIGKVEELEVGSSQMLAAA